MKKKMVLEDSPVTRAYLDEKLQDYPTRAEMNEAFERFRIGFKGEIEALLIQFKSDMFTRFDQIVGELAQIREDRLFADHEMRELKATDEDHAKRIKKLERRIEN